MAPKRLSTLGIVLVIAALAVAVASGAQARQLRYAIGFPPDSDSDIVAEEYAKAVQGYSDGELSVRVYALSLLNFAETSAGLRDGMADIGYMLGPYFPSEYPHMNLVAEASMLAQLAGSEIDGREGMATVGAVSEFVFHHCPECHEEFSAQNQVFTGSNGGSPYGLLCTAPVTSQDDLNGLRVRVAGAQWARWAKAMGASPVTMSGNEVFEGLSQGVVDCTTMAAPNLTNLGLIDVVTDVTMAVPGGVFAGAATTNVNQDVWASLTAEQRRAMLRGGAVMSARLPFRYHQREQDVLDTARQKGVEMHKADPGLVEATHEFIRADMDRIVASYADSHDIDPERGREMISKFRELLDKWVGLVQDVDSAEALTQLYWEEVFSRVDVASYGQ